MVISAGGRHAARASWIPVEQRRLGLDRRSLLPALVVLVIAVALRTGFPVIDSAVAGHEVVRAGDRINLDRGLTVTPPVGWQVVDGLLVGARTVEPGAGSPEATLTQNGVSAQVRVAPFSGDANALLDQIDRNAGRSGDHPAYTDGSRGAVTAAGGLVGVVENHTDTSGDGITAAYALPDGRGLVIQVTGAGNQLSAHTGQISAMLRSVSLEARS
jgi:hypothetical protein